MHHGEDADGGDEYCEDDEEDDTDSSVGDEAADDMISEGEFVSSAGVLDGTDSVLSEITGADSWQSLDQDSQATTLPMPGGYGWESTDEQDSTSEYDSESEEARKVGPDEPEDSEDELIEDVVLQPELTQIWMDLGAFKLS